ncbi:hypothetical protein AB0953_02695 [Streptomyces sp. NPDC046866]|uniref:hypothetical protein n=1 Tax=Streptomyces sp. NPDC046866 TaxID=3154921 RepID=UPI003454E88C
MTTDNAAFFFKPYDTETAGFLLDVCEEITAKSPSGPAEFRRWWADRAVERAMTGETVAIRYLTMLALAKAHTVLDQYRKWEDSRISQIEVNTGKNGDGTDGGSAGQNTGTEGTGTGGCGAGPWGTGTGAGTGTGVGTGAGTGTGVGPGWSGGTSTGGQGGKRGPAVQGSLFVIKLADLGHHLPAWMKEERVEADRLATHSKTLSSQARAKRDLVADMKMAEAALPQLEDLAQKHRTETTVRGLLTAAGVDAEEMGLTDRVVTWMDDKIRAA